MAEQVFASRALPTLTEILDDRASRAGDRPVYAFLRDGEVEGASLTFGELRRRAVAVAARLASLDARGHRAMLLYPQGLEFLVALFGCLYAGAVAVPMSIPGRKSGLESLRRIAADASIQRVLSSAAVFEHLSRNAADLPVAATSWIHTEATLDAPADWAAPAIDRSEIALLQYTSGSTGLPRGVAVTHGNLAHNQWQIEQCFGDDAGRLVSWLPMFHDMGLGTVLQAIWAGGWCALMPPRSFLQSPRRWLQAISKYRATISGAPDFAFDLCARRIQPEERVGLDLSSWRVAYNGSEPVRAATIERFVQAFSGSGFRRAAFHPVYGLAEATVLVASEPSNEPPVIRSFTNERIEHGRGDRLVGSARGQPLVSCGGPWPGTRIAIVDPETGDERRPGTVGEIWVRGDNVAAGYWGMENETAATFRATTSDGEGPFLRTGDLGFVDDNHLFITGRLKDLIIIRGLNHYPQDIEASVSDCHPGLVPNGCAAFSIESGVGECLVVVQEVARSAVRRFDAPAALAAIRRVVSDDHGLQAHAVVLVKPSTIPRTSSGKVRRNACRSAFLEKSLDTLVSWEASEADGQSGDAGLAAEREAATVDPSDVAGAFAAYASTIGDLREGGSSHSKSDLQDWIVSWLARRLRVPISQVEVGRSFADHGLDSVAAVELSTELSEKLGCRFEETLLWNFPSIQALAEWSFTGRPHVASRFEADAALEAGVRPAAMIRAEPTSVLLTGATGFLGAFLLSELLVRTRCHVTCLVRAADARAGFERVARNLRKYELWNDEVASRFSVLVGDLEQPNLGLGPAAFHHLVDGVDAIYNNGARLSFVAGYDDLKPSHVNATREILRLASRGRPKAVHHVSSIAVFDAAVYRGRTLSESTPPVESRGIHLPYAQCKWLSETLVRAAAARGIPVTIHRPGLIAGSSTSGAWSNADFLCRMLKAVIELRCMPGDLDLELDFSPVDYVSRAIIHLSRQSVSIGRSFHLQHPRALHLEKFGQILRSLGYEVTPVSYRDWVERIRARPDGPLYPLVPFLAHRWHPEDLTYVELAQRAERPRLRCDETFEALASAGIECPPLDSHLIARYVHYLTRTGFLGGRARETSSTTRP